MEINAERLLDELRELVGVQPDLWSLARRPVHELNVVRPWRPLLPTVASDPMLFVAPGFVPFLDSGHGLLYGFQVVTFAPLVVRLAQYSRGDARILLDAGVSGIWMLIDILETTKILLPHDLEGCSLGIEQAAQQLVGRSPLSWSGLGEPIAQYRQADGDVRRFPGLDALAAESDPANLRLAAELGDAIHAAHSRRVEHDLGADIDGANALLLSEYTTIARRTQTLDRWIGTGESGALVRACFALNSAAA